MSAFLIITAALFVGAMLWAGQHALLVIPLVALLWTALLVAELRDLRPAPLARRMAASRRHRAPRERVSA